MSERGAFTLTWPQRAAMATYNDIITSLPGIWTEVSEETQDQSSDYSRGYAAGLDMAAKELKRHLDKLAEVTPSCEHDKRVTTRCWDCFG